MDKILYELQKLEKDKISITSEIFSYLVARTRNFEEVIFVKKYLIKLGLEMTDYIYDLLFDLSENYVDAKRILNETKNGGFNIKDEYYSRMFWKDINQNDYDKAINYYKAHHKKQATWDAINNPTMKNYELITRNNLREKLKRKYPTLDELIQIKSGSKITDFFNVLALEPKKRSREYKSYDDSIRDLIVYEYLFQSRTHRWLDEHVIGMNPVESRGYQAMGILHFIGLKDKHKGIFKDWSIQEAIKALEQQKSDFNLVIESLKRYGRWDYANLKVEGEPRVDKYIELESIVTITPEQIAVTETEKEQVIKSRIGQSTFKKELINIERKCRLCGVSDERFLVASHIKPWSKSNNQERLDVNNGLLLCPNHDSLFDKGFISFDEDGIIMISERLGETTKVFININETMSIRMNRGQKQYMKWHRENMFKI
jgi:hypothetical protein